MRYIVTPDQMRMIDQMMIDGQGIPGIVLMEHAAMGVMRAMMERLPPGGCALALCGGGNNGGDGLSALRQLRMHGVDARGVLLCTPDALTGDARKQYDMAIKSGVLIAEVLSEADMECVALNSADVLIDALFGTGLKRELEGRYLCAVERMNASNIPIVAVDIPSGIDGETGEVRGAAVRANSTVTFQHKKWGHLLYPGREYAGEVCVVPIGIPPIATGYGEEWTHEDVLRLVPPRKRESHKGQFGKALLIAGSAQYAGAAIISSRAALRAGCGLLHLAVPKALWNVVEENPAAIVHAMGASDEWDGLAAQEAIRAMDDAQTIAIGPGLGCGGGIPAMLEAALDTKKMLVIDADGLNALAKNKYLMKKLHENVLLTPHPGEMARLTDGDAKRIAALPVSCAQEATQKWGAAVLLKGATSVIAQGSRLCFNTTGNPGLAKGGSGDVLTGILLALIAQGLCAYDAACCGAYLLGSAADEAAALLGARMLLPTDVIDALGNGAVALHEK